MGKIVKTVFFIYKYFGNLFINLRTALHFSLFFLIEGLHTLEVVLTAGSIHESINGEV